MRRSQYIYGALAVCFSRRWVFRYAHAFHGERVVRHQSVSGGAGDDTEKSKNLVSSIVSLR